MEDSHCNPKVCSLTLHLIYYYHMQHHCHRSFLNHELLGTYETNLNPELSALGQCSLFHAPGEYVCHLFLDSCQHHQKCSTPTDYM